mmetsp:Transcript_4696/g.7543  ORF Transcript_4696/g.7543 Transcript_4696/m.7543 type:complete len:116 (-) Transcript_4696:327-674(-)
MDFARCRREGKPFTFPNVIQAPTPPPGGQAHEGEGLHKRIKPESAAANKAAPPSRATGGAAAERDNAASPSAQGMSREVLTMVGIAVVLLVLFWVAFMAPEPGRTNHSRGRSSGR